MATQARFQDAEGMAALGICELLLLALSELNVISEADLRGARAIPLSHELSMRRG